MATTVRRACPDGVGERRIRQQNPRVIGRSRLGDVLQVHGDDTGLDMLICSPTRCGPLTCVTRRRTLHRVRPGMTLLRPERGVGTENRGREATGFPGALGPNFAYY